MHNYWCPNALLCWCCLVYIGTETFRLWWLQVEGADSQSHKQGIFTLIGSRIFSVCQPIGELDFHFPYYGICVGATYMQYGLISRGPISMTRGWFPKFAPGLDIKIGIVQRVYELSSGPFAKKIPQLKNHFEKRTVCSLIYFLNYAYFDI